MITILFNFKVLRVLLKRESLVYLLSKDSFSLKLLQTYKYIPLIIMACKLLNMSTYGFFVIYIKAIDHKFIWVIG